MRLTTMMNGEHQLNIYGYATGDPVNPDLARRPTSRARGGWIST